MNIVDIIIILLVLFGAFLGFKRGFTRELASFLGFIVVIVLAFLFKNPLSVFFYEHLPFFSFSGFFKGISILNILVYEIIAFLLLVFLFSIILKVVLLITGLFEKILSFTVILGIPSKILGMIVGALEFFVYGFIFLFVFSLPWFDVPEIKESKFRDDILNNTPILTDLSKETIKVFEEFEELKEKYKGNSDVNSFNLEALDMFLKYKVISVDNASNLVEKNKLKIENVETVLDKYKEE